MYVLMTALILAWAALAYTTLYVYGRLGQIEGKLNWLFTEELQRYKRDVRLTAPRIERIEEHVNDRFTVRRDQDADDAASPPNRRN